MYFHPNRLSFAPDGIFGGLPGTKTAVIVNGDALSNDPASMVNGYVTLNDAGERLTLEFSSGAGAGDPTERPNELVRRDVENGLVSRDSAQNEYGA
jgi:N-methylhydantoinase B